MSYAGSKGGYKSRRSYKKYGLLDKVKYYLTKRKPAQIIAVLGVIGGAVAAVASPKVEGYAKQAWDQLEGVFHHKSEKAG